MIASITRSQSARSRVVERRRDPRAHRVGVGLLQLALLDRAGELLLDLRRCPSSSLSWSTSRTTTSQPACAQICVIPWPIRPQPRTPTLLISMRESPSFAESIASKPAAAYMDGTSVIR